VIARLFGWFRGVRGSTRHNDPRSSASLVATSNGAAIPAGAILLNGGVNFEVVGQANHQRSLEAIHRDHANGGDECRVIAALVPDRRNDYDASAIGVSICGLMVAHFSREDGKRYRRVIANVTSHGLAVCRATIRAMPGLEIGAGASFRVSLDLAAPGRAAPPGIGE
jgi:hypothetical protein